MGARSIVESRTTIFYMAGFGMFLLLSYMLVVAPVKQENECYVRSLYSGAQDDQQQVNDQITKDKHYGSQVER